MLRAPTSSAKRLGHPMPRPFQALLVSALVASLSACGGGGAGGEGDNSVSAPAPAPLPAPAPADKSCVGPAMANVIEGLKLISVNTIGIQAHNCQVTNAADGAPLEAGKFAFRIMLKPGDCGGNDGFDDCKNDRARFELSEAASAPTQGQTLVREFRMYLPVQERLRPKGSNLVFLSQLNFGDSSSFGTLAYLELGSDGDLHVRTHKGFTWDTLNLYPVYRNPYGKWISVRYEVQSTAAANGALKVYIDDKLMVDEVRPTLPSAGGVNYLRVGIYNAFLTQATEPYAEQVVYFDGIKAR